MNVYRRIAILAIMIGTIGISINILFGTNTITYLEVYKVENYLTFYKFNFWPYIQNIRTNFEDTTRLTLTDNPRTWINIQGNILQEQFWEDLGNNMAYILNVIVLGLNVFLYPIRIAGYVIKTILAFIGVQVMTINSQNGLYWLVNLCNFLQQLEIPYV